MKKFMKYLETLINSLIIIAIPALTVISFYENWIYWYRVIHCILLFIDFIYVLYINNNARIADKALERYQKEEKERLFGPCQEDESEIISELTQFGEWTQFGYSSGTIHKENKADNYTNDN